MFHTRLKILDLNPRSDQPFLKNDICLIYNGEIYNYIELRKDLETKVIVFTTSDTEVLMNAYIEYGENLELFRGMGLQFLIKIKIIYFYLETNLVKNHYITQKKK